MKKLKTKKISALQEKQIQIGTQDTRKTGRRRIALRIALLLLALASTLLMLIWIGLSWFEYQEIAVGVKYTVRYEESLEAYYDILLIAIFHVQAFVLAWFAVVRSWRPRRAEARPPRLSKRATRTMCFLLAILLIVLCILTWRAYDKLARERAANINVLWSFIESAKELRIATVLVCEIWIASLVSVFRLERRRRKMEGGERGDSSDGYCSVSGRT